METEPSRTRRVEPGRARRGIPVGTNLLVALLCVVANLYQYAVVPLALLPRGGAWAATLVPAAIMSLTHWAILHESIHGHLHPNKRINVALGRVLGVLFGVPFHTVRFGHLLHHRFTGTPTDRPEVYDPERSSRLVRAVAYYPNLLLGAYGSELAAAVLVLLPKARLARVASRAFGKHDRGIGGGTRENASRDGASRLAVNHLVNDRARRAELRLDGALIVLLLFASAACYGRYWPILVLALGARALLISFLDNAYHYGTPLGGPGSSLNLKPLLFPSCLILDFNLHRAHHLRPALPWSSLRATLASTGDRYDGALPLAALRQLRGPIPVHALAAMQPCPGTQASPDAPRWRTAARPTHELAAAAG